MGIKKDFPTYEEAQRRIIAAGILSTAQFRAFDKKSIGIPCHPDRYYRNKGWINWGTFLRNGWKRRRKSFLTYEEAREFVRKLNITNRYDYRQWSKTERPLNIPSCPASYYSHEFKGWWDYLGCPCERKEKIPFLPLRPNPYVSPLIVDAFDKALIALSSHHPAELGFKNALNELMRIKKILKEYSRSRK